MLENYMPTNKRRCNSFAANTWQSPTCCCSQHNSNINSPQLIRSISFSAKHCFSNEAIKHQFMCRSVRTAKILTNLIRAPTISPN